ncbi:NUDIX hydrolase [Acidimicrobium ferrooxidans DSM 10331]|uniref:NUDIX hydrolase n=1 Tax=Acidimicrobium ferrooxidans (strain DSM 10331 / JCM 15462 / NBRC 103882 / ICP) TaxID=525909 RepID=C7LYQ9_ACIFD|nr:NUDIX domain-containing protein [Acidimicrobium ferrooxidans]ACU53867.1 NUDIX hydrolase [Acidimicrobium ferrooxidans DSM 10331]
MARLALPVQRGASTLLVLDGRVLLVRRGSPDANGTWAPPGGHVDPGEDPVAAAIRELAEETGVHAAPVRVLQVAEVLADRGAYVLWTVLATPRGRARGNARSDADALGWFGPDDLRHLRPLAPGVRSLLERLGLIA